MEDKERIRTECIKAWRSDHPAPKDIDLSNISPFFVNGFAHAWHTQQQEIDRLRDALTTLIGFCTPYASPKPGEPKFFKQRLLRSAIEQAEIALEPQEEKVCSACGGDGIETCNNPDHGFLEDFLEHGHGCPVCGHDPDHKVRGNPPCPECNGTGRLSPTQEGESDE